MESDPIDELDIPAIDALVAGLTETRRAIASLQAFETTLMSAAADVVAARISARPALAEKDLPWREVAAEIGAALHMNDRTVEGRLGEAALVVGRFPATHAAWAAGEIDQSRVRVIVDAGGTLTDEDSRAEYEARVLAHAAQLTPGRLKPLCRRIAATLDPESVTRRHKRARRTRAVRTVDLEDGMSRLVLEGPATLIHSVFDRITQMARTVQETGRGGRGRSGVQADDGGRTGGGPRAADEQVGQPRPAAGNERVDQDRDEGPLVAADERVDERTLDQHLHRMLRIRDEHCRFPGCRQPTWRGDLDHTRDAARGGPTRLDNLEHLCRRHHVLKHRTRWTVRQLPGGVLEWTSPTGHTYEDHPSPQVRFACTDPPPF